MNSFLVLFLRDNLNEIIWCVVPGGIICGELGDFDEDSHTFGLQSAVFFTGSAKLELGDSSVLADHVSAWGMETPTLPEED